MIRLNGIQDQRLQILTDANGRTATAVNDLGRLVGSVAGKLGDMRKWQAVMEERIGHAGPPDS